MNNTSVVIDPKTKKALGFPLHAKELCDKQEAGLHVGDLVLVTLPVPGYLRVKDGFVCAVETEGANEGFFICSRGLLDSKKGETDVGFILRSADNLEIVSVLGHKSKKRKK